MRPFLVNDRTVDMERAQTLHGRVMGACDRDRAPTVSAVVAFDARRSLWHAMEDVMEESDRTRNPQMSEEVGETFGVMLYGQEALRHLRLAERFQLENPGLMMQESFVRAVEDAAYAYMRLQQCGSDNVSTLLGIDERRALETMPDTLLALVDHALRMRNEELQEVHEDQQTLRYAMMSGRLLHALHMVGLSLHALSTTDVDADRAVFAQVLLYALGTEDRRNASGIKLPESAKRGILAHWTINPDAREESRLTIERWVLDMIGESASLLSRVGRRPQPIPLTVTRGVDVTADVLAMAEQLECEGIVNHVRAIRLHARLGFERIVEYHLRDGASTALNLVRIMDLLDEAMRWGVGVLDAREALAKSLLGVAKLALDRLEAMLKQTGLNRTSDVNGLIRLSLREADMVGADTAALHTRWEALHLAMETQTGLRPTPLQEQWSGEDEPALTAADPDDAA